MLQRVGGGGLLAGIIIGVLMTVAWAAILVWGVVSAAVYLF